MAMDEKPENAAQEPGPEERVVPPAEVGYEEAEQPLPAFPDVLSDHLLTC